MRATTSREAEVYAKVQTQKENSARQIGRCPHGSTGQEQLPAVLHSPDVRRRESPNRGPNLPSSSLASSKHEIDRRKQRHDAGYPVREFDDGLAVGVDNVPSRGATYCHSLHLNPALLHKHPRGRLLHSNRRQSMQEAQPVASRRVENRRAGW